MGQSVLMPFIDGKTTNVQKLDDIASFYQLAVKHKIKNRRKNGPGERSTEPST
jgi:hypothetical protein